MKVLWLCNMMLPVIAAQFHIEASNKEGWLSGLADVMLERHEENDIELSVAFPVPASLLERGRETVMRELTIKGVKLSCYGFLEDTANPHVYDRRLEDRLKEVCEKAKPDVVHIFGTEYPHTLAMCRVFPKKERILIAIQGLCSVYSNVYEADMPTEVIFRRTFRDILKKDDILQQISKFFARGVSEQAAVSIAGNVGGRTAWDRHYATEWNPSVRYFELNETLRPSFYEGRWKREDCVPHSIFLSQGDYPIKGLHYMLLALPDILKEYPDAHVYVAGNSIVEYGTLKEKLKISSYGKYLRQLMKENQLFDKVTFLGRLDAAQMKERYLKSHLFVCCSSIENSPNSLGEAMLLGMPCVTADVGGIPSIFTADVDGIMYAGCKSELNSFDKDVYQGKDKLLRNAQNLSRAVLAMWSDPGKEKEYCENARAHALRLHDRQRNYEKTVEAYAEIAGKERKE